MDRCHVHALVTFLAGVHSVYMDEEEACKFTYEIILAFDHKMMKPHKLHLYRHWNNLNHIYGVVNISHELVEELKGNDAFRIEGF